MPSLLSPNPGHLAAKAVRKYVAIVSKLSKLQDFHYSHRRGLRHPQRSLDQEKLHGEAPWVRTCRYILGASFHPVKDTCLTEVFSHMLSSLVFYPRSATPESSYLRGPGQLFRLAYLGGTSMSPKKRVLFWHGSRALWVWQRGSRGKAGLELP